MADCDLELAWQSAQPSNVQLGAVHACWSTEESAIATVVAKRIAESSAAACAASRSEHDGFFRPPAPHPKQLDMPPRLGLNTHDCVATISYSLFDPSGAVLSSASGPDICAGSLALAASVMLAGLLKYPPIP